MKLSYLVLIICNKQLSLFFQTFLNIFISSSWFITQNTPSYLWSIAYLYANKNEEMSKRREGLLSWTQPCKSTDNVCQICDSGQVWWMYQKSWEKRKEKCFFTPNFMYLKLMEYKLKKENCLLSLPRHPDPAKKPLTCLYLCPNTEKE